MKKPILLLLASMMMFTSCSLLNRLKPSSQSSNNPTSSESGGSSSSSSSSSSGSSSGSSSSSSSGDEDEHFDDDTTGKSISLSENNMILKITKYEYLTVDFSPEEEFDDEKKEGTWTTSNSSVATVSAVGKVTGVAKGTATICYTTTVDHLKAYCTVTVVNSDSDIKREYVKVTDMDSITVGDQIVFGCPSFGVTASLDRKDGYLKYTSTTFSDGGNKIASLGTNTGEFYVGQGADDSLTLESQEGLYLAGKKTDRSGGLLFVKSKGQINWSFERVSSSDYCHNFDIDWGWLMFNKISNTDIRFNLYESNETALMKLPTIYRLTITELS